MDMVKGIMYWMWGKRYYILCFAVGYGACHFR